MPKVTIYTAPECPHSRVLKQFLAELRVDYDEKCILTSPEIASELKELSGHMAVPTTVIEDSVFVGYDKRAERRIKRTLGV